MLRELFLERYEEMAGSVRRRERLHRAVGKNPLKDEPQPEFVLIERVAQGQPLERQVDGLGERIQARREDNAHARGKLSLSRLIDEREQTHAIVPGTGCLADMVARHL